MPSAGAVIVGASLAGLRAAETLRHDGYDGPLTVVGAEPHLPYDRPPLSKQLLTGKVEVADVKLALDAGLDLDWRLGTEATGLDLRGSVIALRSRSSGAMEELAFESLIIATGSQPRRPANLPEIEGVHVLRTVEDSLAIRQAFCTGSPRVVIVGAGVIGLEVASSATALGLEVTVLEMAPLPLSRVVGPTVGQVCAELHRDHGVDLRLGVAVDGLAGDRRVEGVRLAGGEIIPADVVVFGIGVAPATGWLVGSGVDLDDGVRCDSRLRVLSGGVALPHVAAAGDVARWDLPGAGPTRVEHWTNAADQGPAAGAVLLHGDATPEFGPVPYMWSDQHDRKLQVVGLPRPGDEAAIVDGSLEARKFVVAFGREGRLVAAAGFSRPAKVMALKAQIEAGGAFPPEP